jgi:excisionase family DNA binding protein
MDGWMTELEAAKYLGLSDATLKRLRYEGTGPAHGKPGKTALYKREDLDAWVRGKDRKTEEVES